jgi:hypothetical protein
MIPIMFIFEPPPTPQKTATAHSKIFKRKIGKGLPLESKRMIVAFPFKENRHRAFIVKKGPPPEFNPSYNCTVTLNHIACGVPAQISVPWYFLWHDFWWRIEQNQPWGRIPEVMQCGFFF